MAILGFAVKEKRLPELPEWKKLREPFRAPLAFTIDEFARILCAAAKAKGTINGIPGSLWWKAILLAIWYTGANHCLALRSHV